MKKDIVIKLKSVSKKYIIHHDKPTLSERLIKGKGREFNALKNINLAIKKGERVGFIGANGSGKTTLLKTIAGISNPTLGHVFTEGKIVSLIDLEAGFHPDLNGVQNIILNGTLLGMTKLEISNQLQQIIEFADIGKFINAPLFTYSEGMKLRLGFSVAVHSNPDILVLDENIAVGDEDFKNKSYIKIQEFVKLKVTLLIASHNLNFIEESCDKALWIGNGRIIRLGKVNKVIKDYLNNVRQ